jgi:uncharacterized protein (TIGR03067 family)
LEKRLPSRPNLDHLRGQAKSLLAALAAGDADAAKTFLEHLPAAKGMTAARVRGAGLRLADAQSAVARKSGFSAWPALARHVEQLRALEGTWTFERLEVDGASVPPEAVASSRLLIDGDRFRTESPEGTYEGVFNIDVEAEPHHIDIEFVAGPEAGRWNYGIFRVEGGRLEICLDVNGRARPAAFEAAQGSGHAYETLKRSSNTRPRAVDGGAGAAKAAGAPAPGPAGSPTPPPGFEHAPSETLARLQGEWSAERLVKDGQVFPAMMLKTGRRTAVGNELKIHFGGQLIIHALVRIDESERPVHVDYFNLAGPARGVPQHGVMEWRDGDACFCMGAPGGMRPDDFECPPGSGRTLSIWRSKKP